MTSLDDLLHRRPVDTENVQRHRDRMLAECYAQMAEDMRSTRVARRSRAVRVRRGNVDAE